ncbi:MAG TPA: hypothetical protein VL754_06230 [Verrucomicrobiae bacterium]|nr:hypothetical protein [Verrucomicrobiae bacterium]
MRAIFMFVAVIVVVIGCNSPETSRSRGGGSGADVGNRTKNTAAVRMHEGSDPFAKTPKIIPTQGPSLDGARQANRLSRP